MYGLSGGVPLLVSVEDSDSSPGSHPLIWWVIGGGALSVSKVPHTPKREGPAIRNGLWGPSLFLCAVWLLVSLDSYVPLVNGCGVGAMTLLVIAPGYLMECSASPSVSSPAL